MERHGRRIARNMAGAHDASRPFNKQLPMPKKRRNPNAPNTLQTSAYLLLVRTAEHAPWILRWPGHAQEAHFASLTHDEIMRWPNLEDFLSNRIGIVSAKLTLTLSQRKEFLKESQSWTI